MKILENPEKSQLGKALRQDIPQYFLLTLQVNYRAWRSEYLESKNMYLDEKSQLENFANRFIKFAVQTDDYHEIAHVVYASYSGDVVKAETIALFFQLIYGPSFEKNLGRIFLYCSGSDQFPKAAYKVLLILTKCYSEELKELVTKENAVPTDFLLYLKGIDKVQNGKMGDLKNEVKLEIFQ